MNNGFLVARDVGLGFGVIEGEALPKESSLSANAVADFLAFSPHIWGESYIDLILPVNYQQTIQGLHCISKEYGCSLCRWFGRK